MGKADSEEQPILEFPLIIKPENYTYTPLIAVSTVFVSFFILSFFTDLPPTSKLIAQLTLGGLSIVGFMSIIILFSTKVSVNTDRITFHQLFLFTKNFIISEIDRIEIIYAEIIPRDGTLLGTYLGKYLLGPTLDINGFKGKEKIHKQISSVQITTFNRLVVYLNQMIQITPTARQERKKLYVTWQLNK